MAGRGGRFELPSPGNLTAVSDSSACGGYRGRILSRAGIFQGVEPSAVSALTKQFQRVDFPRGHTVFGQGEPGDRLHIIVSGQVKIGIRSSGPAAGPADRKVPGAVSGSKHGRLSPISRSTTTACQGRSVAFLQRVVALAGPSSQCTGTGNSTLCQRPGNAQIVSSPPVVSGPQNPSLPYPLYPILFGR